MKDIHEVAIWANRFAKVIRYVQDWQPAPFGAHRMLRNKLLRIGRIIEAVKDEEHYGIIFQRETNPARHGCDLSFHRAGNYSFLQDYSLGKNVESLIALFVHGD